MAYLKGSFEIPDVKQFSWFHPVIADGKLWLREQNNLFIYLRRGGQGDGPRGGAGEG